MLIGCKLHGLIQNLWMILANLWIKSTKSLDGDTRKSSKPFKSLSKPIQKGTKKWMEPLGIHPLKVEHHPVFRPKICPKT